MNDLHELLYISPRETYQFSEDDILLAKLTWGINVQSLNGKNPYLVSRKKTGGIPKNLVDLMIVSDILETIAKDSSEGFEFVDNFLNTMDQDYCGIDNPWGLYEEDCYFANLWQAIFPSLFTPGGSIFNQQFSQKSNGKAIIKNTTLNIISGSLKEDKINQLLKNGMKTLKYMK